MGSALVARRYRPPGLAHPALPEDPVDLVPQRHVERERAHGQDERRRDALLLAREAEGEEREQHQRGDAGARGRALPRGLQETAVLRSRLSALALVRRRLAAGPAAGLDRAGGVAAVLATTLALGLGHGLRTLAAQQRFD